jgi:hypothetical protein
MTAIVLLVQAEANTAGQRPALAATHEIMAEDAHRGDAQSGVAFEKADIGREAEGSFPTRSGFSTAMAMAIPEPCSPS